MVEAGERIAIIGANGAGKTTTAALHRRHDITGLMPITAPSSGRKTPTSATCRRIRPKISPPRST
jgi:ABC-type molybdenum transport system ATPase subunit/photorepair protein PhrA